MTAEFGEKYGVLIKERRSLPEGGLCDREK